MLWALTQLLDISLSFGHVAGYYKAHRTYPLLRHLFPLCKAVQVIPMPWCYLSRLREAEACSIIDYQLVGGSTQVESADTDCTQ